MSTKFHRKFVMDFFYPTHRFDDITAIGICIRNCVGCDQPFGIPRTSTFNEFPSRTRPRRPRSDTLIYGRANDTYRPFRCDREMLQFECTSPVSFFVCAELFIPLLDRFIVFLGNFEINS